MKTRTALAWAAGLEVSTGLSLAADPSYVPRLLFGEGVAGAGAALGRITGLGLLCLGLACWPGRDDIRGVPRTLRALLIYNVLVLLLLVWVGLGGGPTGPLLWPSVGLHAVLAAMLVGGWRAALAGRERSAV